MSLGSRPDGFSSSLLSVKVSSFRDEIGGGDTHQRPTGNQCLYCSRNGNRMPPARRRATAPQNLENLFHIKRLWSHGWACCDCRREAPARSRRTAWNGGRIGALKTTRRTPPQAACGRFSRWLTASAFHAERHFVHCVGEAGTSCKKQNIRRTASEGGL